MRRSAFSAAVVVGLLLGSSARASEADFPPPSDEPAPRTPERKGDEGSCADCLRGVLAIGLGVDTGLLLRSGPNDGAPIFGLGVGLTAAGFVQSKRLVYAVVLDEGATIGGAGLQYIGDTMLGIGVRGITSAKRVVDQGLFLRTGISAVVLGNNAALARVLDFPYGEVGWSLVTDGFGFQAYARAGAAVVGELSAGRRFEDRDARRQIDPALEGGLGATLGFGERFALDGRVVEILADGPGGSVRYATGRACVTLTEAGAAKIPIGACARGSLVSSGVEKLRDVAPFEDPWSRWSVGFVGLTMGIGAGAVGTAERHFRD